MDTEIERAILHYYPTQALVSPLQRDDVEWDYDAKYEKLKALLADLKKLDPELRPGTRGRYDISEEVVLVGALRLQLSYLAPIAALNHGDDRDLDEDEREVKTRTEALLRQHGVRLLSAAELAEPVAWIRHGAPKGARATVWDCLFVLPE